MARDGLFVLVCAAGVVAAGSGTLLSAPPEGDTRADIAKTLAVQTALQKGRDHLLHGNAGEAVYVLESELAHVNGSREYLTVLRDAYRAHIKELRLANDEEAAQRYFKRLQILDPGVALDSPAPRAALQVPAPVPPAPPIKQPAAEPAPADRVTARGKMDDDPFQDTSKAREARLLLDQAEQEFSKRRFGEAGRLYEKVHQADQYGTAACRERWAYCKMCVVGEHLNQPSPSGPSYADLEKEVQVALRLTPNLTPRLEEFGKTLLREIDQRRGGPADAKPEAAPVQVRHLARSAEGWEVAETANFRVYHTQGRELGEKAAQAAERTRTEMQRKWFGERSEDWTPKCELYLHATGQDYSRVTQAPATSPGHSTIRSDSGRVISRRIDLHCDDANMISAVLPHEATHVVLAGRFGDQPVPRWADEGMAVLTEPREKIDRHLRHLPEYRQNSQLFPVRQLMTLNDYPDPRYIGSFYAQSVSVVEFLTKAGGAQTFSQFLREGLRSNNYEAALKRHYGYSDFNELEQRWRQFAFPETSVAERDP